MTDTAPREVPLQIIDDVVIRFAGDSGDGMQLTGDRFTSASALFGNDLSTLPEFPAEIRAPAGTLAGVSAFQVRISDHRITSPGDAPDVLVAMNPAALKSQLAKVRRGGTIIVNEDTFTDRNLAKAGYEENPLEDGSIEGRKLIRVPMTEMTKKSVEHLGVKPRDAERSKNFYALGLVSWLYSRPVEPTLDWIEEKFAGRQQVIDANTAAFRAGHAFGETAELFDHHYEVKPAPLAKGTYTQITGNTALAWGLIAASQSAKLPLFLGSYPITPASDVLHELSRHKNFGVRTLQAEDEIAAVGAALGAAFGGHLAVTTTSGPGLALKAETVGLAVIMELPLVIVNIQRGGPSTGLPTKPEQADLFQAVYGRHGESPMPVVAARSPADCFWAALEASRLAVQYTTPVLLLTDGFLANSSEPWLLPDVDDLPDLSFDFASEPNAVDADGQPVFHPYARDPETLARPIAPPGTPGLMHRIGGLEKADLTGNVSYDSDNHEHMVGLRAAKVAGIANSLPPVEVTGADDPETLLVGWGSTWGAIDAATQRLNENGTSVGHLHIRHIYPLPADLGDRLQAARRVIVPELNSGQLIQMLRAEFLVDAIGINQVRGEPFTAASLVDRVTKIIEEG
ncbi:MAG: 2-oxoacid:acceptor oxidoreductase subunit alpha [Actinomycetota bacterium]